MNSDRILLVVANLGVAALWLVWAATPLLAQSPSCDALSPDQLEYAQAILNTEFVYDCCDGTIADCLRATPHCCLAERLAEEVCRRLSRGQDEAHIRHALARRARRMVAFGRAIELDLTRAAMVGEDTASVTLVVIAGPQCLICAELMPELRQMVESGVLQGQVRLAQLSPGTPGLSANLLPGDSTLPTVLLNGRRWVGELDLEAILEAVAEEQDRLQGTIWCPRSP